MAEREKEMVFRYTRPFMLLLTVMGLFSALSALTFSAAFLLLSALAEDTAASLLLPVLLVCAVFSGVISVFLSLLIHDRKVIVCFTSDAFYFKSSTAPQPIPCQNIAKLSFAYVYSKNGPFLRIGCLRWSVPGRSFKFHTSYKEAFEKRLWMQTKKQDSTTLKKLYDELERRRSYQAGR